MMAIIYASIMMLWFWGSKQKDAFFVSKYHRDIKTLPQLLRAVPPTKKAAATEPGAEEEPQRLMVVPTKQMVGARYSTSRSAVQAHVLLPVSERCGGDPPAADVCQVQLAAA